MAERGLTPKQEAFAVEYVRTANAAASYRFAYDVEPNARDEWIYTEALQLLDHPRIAPRIAELQEKAKERGQYNIFEAADELSELKLESVKAGQFGPAVSAVKEKIKMFGLEAPSKVQQLGKDGQPVDPPKEISDVELARRMAFVLYAAAKEDNDG